MSVVAVLSFVLVALGDAHAHAAMSQTESAAIDNPATLAVSSGGFRGPSGIMMHIITRINHTTPLVDSLVPIAPHSASATPSDPEQITTAAVVISVSFLALFIMAAIIFLLVRYLMRRAAIKRRRQASWILRSGQWNMPVEPKRTHAHETRSGFSDTSSFSAYPYPLSEHF